VSDPDLAAAARDAGRGDQEAFARLVRATQADVARACTALVDRAAAEDLVQETYLRAYAALPGFRADASVRTWLLGIARHVCIDELRRRSRRRAFFRSLPPTSEALTPTAATDLELLLAALANDRREAFVLTQLVGLSYVEAAAVCDCAVGTIRSRVARARADLLEALEGEQQSGSA
jgi:RNA polymerase sigma-70 factor (ECF subfamily)